MSYAATKYVVELDGLTPTEKAVAHSLAHHANPDGSDSFPSMTTIAREAGLKDRRCAQYVVRRLESKGVIFADTSKAGGRQKSTRYRFDLENSEPVFAVSGKAKSEPEVAVSPQSANPDALNSEPGRTKQRIPIRTNGPNGPNSSSSAANASGKKSSSARPTFSHFPEDFVPNEENRKLASKLGLNIDESVAAFADHHVAKGSRMADWHRGLNSWMRNEKKFTPSRKKSENAAPQYGDLSENMRLMRERLG